MIILVLLALQSTALEATAYDTSLQSSDVREAYFLGKRGDEKTTAFLAAYAAHPSLPERGPYISEITLYTPYAQVVLNSWRNAAAGNSAQQAEHDFYSEAETIRVGVQIRFTATYSAVEGTKTEQSESGTKGYVPRPENFWRDFQFALLQKGEAITAKRVEGKAVYEEGGFVGADVVLVYDVKKVASEDTSVEVTAPDKHVTAAKFDLQNLR